MLNLPKEAQDAINASNWEKISEEIGKKYLLDEDEIETFQLETASFLLGLVDEDLYLINIENEVGTSKDEANKIAEEVIQKIFTPVNDVLTENIKKGGKSKNPNAEQTLNFILSGGDYSAFLVPTRENSPLEEYPLGGGGNASTPSRERATPQEGNNIPIKPGKMEDIKSKFTI